MDKPQDAMERRAFLATGAIAGAAALSMKATQKPTPRPLVVGESVGLGWVLVAFKTGHAGAHIVTLRRSDDEQLRVMLTRAEPSAGGALASTGTVDLVLLNDGGGRHKTSAMHVAAVEALAERLAGHEDALPRKDVLLTSSERQRRFRPIDHDVV